MKHSQILMATIVAIFSSASLVFGQTPDDAPEPVSTPLDSLDVQVNGPDKVQKDSPVEYRILVRNNGSADLDDIAIEAVLTEQFAVESSNPTADQKGDRLIWKLARVRAGDSVELNFSAIAQAAGAGRVRAFARMDGNEGSDEQPPKLPETQESISGLSLQVRGPDQIKVGQTFTCEARITNQSGKAIENGGFSLNLTKGLRLQEAPNVPDGPLRLEDDRVMTIPITIVAMAAGVQGVRAQVEFGDGQKIQSEHEFQAEQPEFGVQIETAGEHVLGQPLKLRFYIANNREQPTDNVQLMVQIPDNIEIISGEAGALFNRNTRTVRWRAGQMESGEERGFRLTVKPNVAGDFEFTATAQSPAGLNAKSAKRVRAVGHVALGVIVEPNNDVVVANDLLSVTFEVRSRGTQAATAPSLTLETSPAFQFEAERSSGWTLDDKQWVFQSPRNVPPGETQRATIVLRAITPGDQLLRATVTCDDVVGEIIRTQPVRIVPAPPPIPAETESARSTN